MRDAVAERPRRRVRVAGLVFGVLAALGVLEAGLRGFVRTGPDGEQSLFGNRLVPNAAPPLRTADDDGSSYIRYDPVTGWSPRPLATDPSVPYHTDQHGLRAPSPAARTFDGDPVHVGLFGDSFAHSDEVPYDESLGAALERVAERTRVLVAGVPAFGTDQAYLRYLALREHLRFDVVVIGVHPNDFFRNAALWTQTGRSKPRFVETPSGLELVNRVPVAGAEFRSVFDDFESWPLARHQFLHVPGAYDRRASDGSIVLRLLRSLGVNARRAALYRETTTTGSRNEVHRVTEQVVRAFVRAAEEAGAEAVVAVLPSATHLVDVERGNPWWDGALRRAVEGTGAVVADPTAALLDAAVSRRLPYDRMFTRGGAGHATAEGNALIAERLRPAVSDAVGRARSRR